jgi:hypothetical protein
MDTASETVLGIMLWWVAGMIITFAIGKYLAGVVEFKDWKWPWR